MGRRTTTPQRPNAAARPHVVKSDLMRSPRRVFDREGNNRPHPTPFRGLGGLLETPKGITPKIGATATGGNEQGPEDLPDPTFPPNATNAPLGEQGTNTAIRAAEEIGHRMDRNELDQHGQPPLKHAEQFSRG